MANVPGVDRPAEETDVDVTLPGRDISVDCRVEVVTGDVLAVRPSVSGYPGREVVAVGDEVEVVWRGAENLRILPATVLAVERGAVVRWRLRATGPVEARQRRKQVRARVVVPVEAGYLDHDLTGESVDLSEAGMRVTVDRTGLLPEAGSTMDLVIKLETGEVTTRAEVVRHQDRGARWLLSLRFLDLGERDGDTLRRRVFQALREERARSAG